MMFKRGYSSNESVEVLPLPLFHSTKGSKIDDIFADEAIKSQKKNFEAICLSYGKPSYSYKISTDQGDKKNYLPFAFVFDSNVVALENSAEAYCFDIGGIRGAFYEPEIDRRTSRQKFFLGTCMKDIINACKELFENNSNYFSAKSRSPSSFGALITKDIESYLNIVERTNKPDSIHSFDPCSHTFEARVASPLNIINNSIALIGPAKEFNQEKFIKFSEEFSIDLIPYDSSRASGCMSVWFAMLNAIVIEFSSIYKEVE